MTIQPFIPLITTIAFLIAGKGAKTAVFSGLLAFIAVVLIGDYHFSALMAMDATWNSAVLVLSAAFVIIPGQYFNELLQSQGNILGLVKWLDQLPVRRPVMALIVVLGVAPTVESLTGFGVSLFLTVPLLIHLYPADKALKLSLLSMNIMPWGTLGLATAVGAQIGGVSTSELGQYTSIVSSLVFPCIGVLSGLIVSEGNEYKFNCFAGLVLGSLLSCFLVLFNFYFHTESAGVFAGLCLTLIAGTLFLERDKPIPRWSKLLSISKPYLILLLLIIVSGVTYNFWEALAEELSIKAEGVTFNWLKSPGTMLLLAASYYHISGGAKVNVSSILTKSAKPIYSIFLFLFMAQLMYQVNMFSEMGEILLSLGESKSLLISPILGMVSGYITGSNLGANTLMMGVQSVMGEHTNNKLIYLAVQNSAAGHAVFSSIPIIVMAITISKTGGAVVNEADVTRYAFFSMLILLLAVTLTATVMGFVLEL
ncbi:hypothetical protein A9Q81_06405 [Gammaproteobacteria bacterium 42_54_T18]|nr:hypothetical protein A9Q81_06405 [Gammaproteobacteria bacterium 42_54_T18]